MTKRLDLLPALAIALLTAGRAEADVRAGVEAWSRADYSTAIREWEAPAARGDADAQFNLAQAYKWGRGVGQNLAKAELLYGKAASQGHMQAADEYGLLLFDRGERVMALPYVKAASERGDPRAQYLMAIACFNGDLVPRDWLRAYALMSLSRTAGLPQAGPALQQMDNFIPLADRQKAVALSQKLAADVEAARNRQFAAADLGVQTPSQSKMASAPAAPMARGPAPFPTPSTAVGSAARIAADASPRTAGADYARPHVPTMPPTAPASALVSAPPSPKPKPDIPAFAAKPAAAVANGTWRLQFGAFGVPANADTLWARLKSRAELAGHARINVAAGNVIKLQAAGYDESTARTACDKLVRAGFTCVPVRN